MVVGLPAKHSLPVDWRLVPCGVAEDAEMPVVLRAMAIAARLDDEQGFQDPGAKVATAQSDLARGVEGRARQAGSKYWRVH